MPRRSHITPEQLIRARQLLAELAITLSDTTTGDVSGVVPDTIPPRLIPVDGACEALSVSRWTLYRLMRERHLASVKIGARRFIASSEIERFLRDIQAVQGAQV